MVAWQQYIGAFITGSGGAALVSAYAQMRRSAVVERTLSRHNDSLDRHQLIDEAADMFGEMRREIDRLRRDLTAVRTECEARQAGVRAEVEIMHREVCYWQQVAAELRRDNALLKAEVNRLTTRVRELEQCGD
jgi:uncharacterized coiled-coil protein SlyX